MAHHSHSSRNALLMFSSKFPSHLYLQITFHHITSFRSAEKTTGRTHSEQQHLWMCWGIHKLFFSFGSYRHFRPQAHNKVSTKTHASMQDTHFMSLRGSEHSLQSGTNGTNWDTTMWLYLEWWTVLQKRLAVANPWHVPYHTTLVTVGGIVVLSHFKHDDCVCLCWVCLRWGHC